MSSEITQFYENANILITGGTGYLGKLLTQKLLRVCNINTIYLIARENKGKQPSERLEDICKDVVFEKLKEEKPQYVKKIHIMEGDISKAGLGLSEENRQILIEKIHLVFHCAASMNMDAKLKNAVYTNIRGLNELIELCHEIRNLKSMIYVSTTYSNCTQYDIEERFYDAPIEPEMLLKLTDQLQDKVLDSITPGLILEWPNTYCFTKAISERNLFLKRGNLPVGIFRPSIIMPTYYDPIPGWTSNIYGPVGVMLASGMGILRVFLCSSRKKFDMVPGDYCVNALICSAWEVGTQSLTRANSPPHKAPIYNYAAGCKRSLTWSELLNYCTNYEYPLKDAFWATMLIFTDNKCWFKFLWITLHMIPGYLIDLYLVATGKKARVIKTYNKISKFQNVLSYFSTNQWNIQHNNVDSLWCRLNDRDKKIFPFDMDIINYKKFIENTCTGIKLYIFKETLDNAKAEKMRYQRFVLAHKILKYTLWALFVLFIYKIMNCILKNILLFD